MTTSNARRKAIALAALLLLWAGGVAAQALGDRPIRVVVPYPPGGGTDSVARILAPRLAELVGRPVIVDNKPGGSSAIGLDNVAKSRPDGHTLGVVNMAFVANPSLMKLPYDTDKDFVPITMVTTLPLVVAVSPSVPPKTSAPGVR